MRLITVVLGTDSANKRVSASQALLNYGFRFFETYKLSDADTELKKARVWKGATDSISLGLDRPMYVTIPRGRYNGLSASVNISNRIVAPVESGSQIGKVSITLDNDVIAEQQLVSLQAVAVGSFWQRITDEALLYFE